jgi:hypothetical protein
MMQVGGERERDGEQVLDLGDMVGTDWRTRVVRLRHGRIK